MLARYGPLMPPTSDAVSLLDRLEHLAPGCEVSISGGPDGWEIVVKPRQLKPSEGGMSVTIFHAELPVAISRALAQASKLGLCTSADEPNRPASPA